MPTRADDVVERKKVDLEWGLGGRRVQNEEDDAA